MKYAKLWCLCEDFAELTCLDCAAGDPLLMCASLCLSVMTWPATTGTLRRVYGDNTEALQNALSLKGRGPLLQISRVLTWRQAMCGWIFECFHLTKHRNLKTDDALSPWCHLLTSHLNAAH